MGGATVWFTGLPSAGKSTIAAAVADRLLEAGQGRHARPVRQVLVLDGDELRRTVSAGLGFGRPDREENVRRIGRLAEAAARKGAMALVPVIAPYADGRARIRRRHAEVGIPFLEVYVAAPVEVCARRDVKGLYARQARGELSGLTGVDDPYEAPTAPELRIDTEHEPIAASVAAVWQLLISRGLV
ncbi:MAG: adenylyl-sulfate kinase [Catenulispora sp.]|nr:adenylyl-sulfate kinase [Catenulispora sp.]